MSVSAAKGAGASAADGARDLPLAAVLGAGTMGAQVALSLALGGVPVRLWARREDGIEPARGRIAAAFDFLAGAGLAAAAERADVLGRVTIGTDLAAAIDGSGFVLEAIVEELDAKRALLAEAERHCAPGTVLSSTTSALSPTELQSGLTRPEAFCVAHYAQPAHLVALVEVVPGAATSEPTTAFVERLLADTGKVAVRCPDVPGFLWARIQHAVLREFASLVGRGLVTPEACDTVLREGYAARLPAMGAFEHADLAGLDLMNGDAARAVWADLDDATDPIDTPVGALHAEGHLGMKSGRGFYDWTVRDPDEFRRHRDEEIVRRVKIRAGGEVRMP